MCVYVCRYVLVAAHRPLAPCVYTHIHMSLRLVVVHRPLAPCVYMCRYVLLWSTDRWLHVCICVSLRLVVRWLHVCKCVSLRLVVHWLHVCICVSIRHDVRWLHVCICVSLRHVVRWLHVCICVSLRHVVRWLHVCICVSLRQVVRWLHVCICVSLRHVVVHRPLAPCVYMCVITSCCGPQTAGSMCVYVCHYVLLWSTDHWLHVCICVSLRLVVVHKPLAPCVYMCVITSCCGPQTAGSMCVYVCHYVLLRSTDHWLHVCICVSLRLVVDRPLAPCVYMCVITSCCGRQTAGSMCVYVCHYVMLWSTDRWLHVCICVSLRLVVVHRPLAPCVYMCVVTSRCGPQTAGSMCVYVCHYVMLWSTDRWLQRRIC